MRGSVGVEVRPSCQRKTAEKRTEGRDQLPAVEFFSAAEVTNATAVPGAVMATVGQRVGKAEFVS